VEARHRFGALFQGPSGGPEEVTIVAVCRDDATRAPGHRRLFTLFLASLLTAVAMLALVVAPARAATRRPAEAPITEAGGVALTQPEGLATDATDNLWVTDTSQALADKFDSSGGFLLQSSGGAHLTGNSEGAAYSEATDRLLVSDSGEDNIWVLKPDGSFESAITSFPSGASGCCYLRVAADDSATATDGDVYVSSVRPSGEEGTVTRLDREGNPADFTAGPDAGTNVLTGPFAIAPRIPIAVAPSGDLYVAAGGTVYRFAASGELLEEFSGAGGTPFSEIFSLAVDPTSGNVLLAGGLDAPTIFELSPSGALEARITAANGSAFGRVRGLAVDSIGRLYAADSGTGRVDVFGPAEPLPIESDGGSVAEVTDSAATLRARINPNAHPTTYQFQYGLTDCVVPGACTSVPAAPVALGSGEAFLEPSQRITGLAPGTTYHYRLLVEDTATETLTAGPDRAFTTQPSSAPSELPDGREWELVSPPDKGGGEVYSSVGGGITQAATDGGAIAYQAQAPTEPGAQGAGSGLEVLSRRSPSGWSSRDLAAPHRVTPGAPVSPLPELRFYSSDLSTAVLQPQGPFEPALSPEGTEQTPYLQTLGSCTGACYRPLITAANVPFETEFGAESKCQEHTSNLCGATFQGASADASHVVIKSTVALTPGAEAGTVADREGELYEWSEGRLQLVSVLPANGSIEELPAPLIPPVQGAGEKQPFLGAALGTREGSAEGAVSDDGTRVFFTYGDDLYLRDTALGRSLQLDAAEPECLAAHECESGGGVFQFASTDGSRVFFTDTQRLTHDSGAGAAEGTSGRSADLYECRIGEAAGRPICELTDLTPAQGGEPARVQGAILGAAADGSSAYLVADGVIPGTGAEPGTCVNKGELSLAVEHCNLYGLREGHPQLVASLSGADAQDWAIAQEQRPTRVSPDGRWLAFLSQDPLTGYDNRDTVSGKLDAEAFIYDSRAGRLVCASCLPGGARPTGVEYGELESGASSVLPHAQAGWLQAGWVAALLPYRYIISFKEPSHQPRYLSDSGRLYFNALDALVPADTNGTGDVYQYEPSGVGGCGPADPGYHADGTGCVDRISSGTSPEASQFIDASESGDDVFFLTTSRLTGADVDQQNDVYDAHVCGAEGVPCIPEPTPPVPPCSGEGCQALTSSPPKATPQTEDTTGPGNAVQCRKGQVKKSGKCVKKKQPKKHKKKHHKKKPHKQSAKSKRGSGK
jgi:sugar lactone lactonase YvrE